MKFVRSTKCSLKFATRHKTEELQTILTEYGKVRVYWPDEAIKLLQQGNVSEISLDHDLGNDEKGTGYDVIKWIEEQVATSDFIPPIIKVHSSNASARQKMELGIKSIQRLVSKRI